MSETQEVELKLVGASTFSSPKIDNRRTINKGEIVTVPEKDAEYLLGLTYLDAQNNEFPYFIRKNERHRSRALQKAQAVLDGEEAEEEADEDSAQPAPRRRRTKA